MKFDVRDSLRSQGICRVFRKGFKSCTPTDIKGVCALTQEKVAFSFEVDVIITLRNRGRQVCIGVQVAESGIGREDLGDRSRGVGTFRITLEERLAIVRINDERPRVPTTFFGCRGRGSPRLLELLGGGSLTIPLRL